MFVHRASLKKIASEGVTILIGKAEVTLQAAGTRFLVLIDAPSDYEVSAGDQRIAPKPIIVRTITVQEVTSDGGARFTIGRAVVTFQTHPRSARLLVLVDAPASYSIAAATPIPPEEVEDGGQNRAAF